MYLYGQGPYGEGPYGESYSVPDDNVASSQTAQNQQPVSVPPSGVDFRIDVSQGIGQMTFEKADNIMNNIYLSLMITQGSWFFNPQFGMRNTGRLKNTEQNAALVRDYAREALQWLLDTGKAVKIEVFSQIEKLIDIYRLKLLVEVTQANDRIITFELFKEMI